MDELLAALLRATSEIRSRCNQDTPTPTHGTTTVSSCGRAITSLLARQATHILALHRPATPPTPPDVAFLRRRLADLLALADARFLAFRFEILPPCWRELYVYVRILSFHLSVLRSRVGADVRGAEASGEVDGLVKELDMALIVAGGGSRWARRVVDELLELLECAWEGGTPSLCEDGGRGAKRVKLTHAETSWEDLDALPEGAVFESPWDNSPSFSKETVFKPPVTNPIPRLDNIPMDAFQAYIDPSTNPHGVFPTIFTDLTSTWPALTTHPWSKPAYLLSRTFGGRRYVPVELGRSYVDAGWSQKLLPFRTFLSSYIDPSLPSVSPAPADQRTGYLAQHDLFTQIPALRSDVLLPDYLWTTPPPHPIPGKAKERVPAPQLNAWLGPAGTITPLHTDAMHNLLCQVVGRKYVRLYPPECAAMCPRGVEGGVDMGNTSRVDVGVVEGWDETPEEGPDISAAEAEAVRGTEFWDCVLEPGDTLYIPIGWWHYVRSLSVSFSVSFWWN